MDENSWRSRARHWLTSHALFEIVKIVAIPAFVGLGISRFFRQANLEMAFNIFWVLLGAIALLWLLGWVRLPTFNKKEEQKLEVFFFPVGLATSLTPSIGRVVINLQFISTKATELTYLHITLRNNKGVNLTCEKSEPVSVAPMQMTGVFIDKKFSPPELATFERGVMVNLDGYAKFRDGGSLKQFPISITTIPSV